jgi:glycosyltransferase involved in cell wall biosynthesis
MLADLAHVPTRNRLRRFGQALVLAAERPADVTWLHAHFIHTPASVTRYAAHLTGLPWSCSAHAKDIWTSHRRDLAGKLAEAAWATTCTRSGAAHLSMLAPAHKPVHLIYHGLDLTRFRGLGLPDENRDGSDPGRPVRLLAVGRAVEKKGFHLLLEALARLPPGLHWRLTHIGGGEQLSALKQQAGALGLAGRIEWLGPQAQEAVLARYRAADLFVLPCRIAGDGDRDGLPNVLMEAQSQSLACLSTTVSAIPELIVSDETGLLVPPDDVAALAGALAQLIAAPEERRRLGAAGEARLKRHFGHRAGIARLAALFGLPEAAPERLAAE